MYSFIETFSQTANTSSFKSFGKSKVEIVKEFSEVVFKEGTIEERPKKYVVTFPGRFQPYHKGHLITYKLLKRMFGDESIFILPSARKSYPFNPLSFEERKKLILASRGITLHPKNIRPRKSLGFNPIGLAKDLGIVSNMEEYIFICVLSIEDTKLMPVKDKETYYQPWPAELYDATKQDLQEVSKYLPSMKHYGFKFTVDAFGAEIIYDFKKEDRKSNFLKKQILIEMGFDTIRESEKQGNLEEIQKLLPYDIELLMQMKDSFDKEEIYNIEQELIEDEELTEEELEREIKLKKELAQQLNQNENMRRL